MVDIMIHVMNRVTFGLHPELEKQLREIHSELIKYREDINFGTTIKMVLFSAIISSNNFSDSNWSTLQKFLDDKKINIIKKCKNDKYYSKRILVE